MGATFSGTGLNEEKSLAYTAKRLGTLQTGKKKGGGGISVYLCESLTLVLSGKRAQHRLTGSKKRKRTALSWALYSLSW